MLGGGLAAALCVCLMYLNVQQENLEPIALLKLVSLFLLGLGFALPWLLVNHCRTRRRQRRLEGAATVCWPWRRSAARWRARCGTRARSALRQAASLADPVEWSGLDVSV